MFTFLGQALRDYHHTGAVLPSSRALALAITGPIRAHVGPKRILEVGPGTGPFTRLIVRHLHEGDAMHIVELSENFCRHLDERYLAPTRARLPNIELQLHQKPIEEAELEGPFDFIVCGLPFNNFPVATVRTIFRRFFDLLGPDGQMMYFEYVGMQFFKRLRPGRKHRLRLLHRIAAQKRVEGKHLDRRRVVLANIPPAYAVRLKQSTD